MPGQPVPIHPRVEAPAATADRAAMFRQSLQLALDRLVADLLAATEDGDWGVTEAGHLATWVHAELLPWSLAAAETLDDAAARAALRSDQGVLTGLNSLLRGSHGDEAAKWARQIQRTGTIMITRLDMAVEQPGSR